MEPKVQQVALSNDSKKEIVSALRDIRKAIVEEDRKSQSFTENIADALTSGSGLKDSILDAIRTESKKDSARLKKALDPLEIVKKMSGGSRLATTLAGKAIGRSDEDIRKTAGFSQNQGQHAEAVSEQRPEPLASPVASSSEMSPLFEQMVRSLSLLVLRVTDIAQKLKAMKKTELDQNGRLRDKVSGQFMSAAEAKSLEKQNELLKSIKDTLMGTRDDEGRRDDRRADADRTERAKRASKPTIQVTASGKDVKAQPAAPDVSPLESLMGSFTSLGKVVGVFGLAVGALLTPLESFKSAMGATLKGVESVVETIRTFTTTKIADIVDKGKDIVNGVKDSGIASKVIATGSRIGQKLLGKTPAAVEAIAPAVKTTEKVAEVGVKAATEVAPKIAKKAPKIGKEKIAKILAKRLPKAFGGLQIGKLIPGVGAALGLGFAVSRLVKGDVMGAALEAVSGFGSAATAIPSIIGNLVRDVYEEAYGVFPEADPLRGDRLPELADSVKDTAAKWLKAGKAEGSPNNPEGIPGKSLQVAQATPLQSENTTGNALAQSTNTRKELADAVPMSSGSAPHIAVNNINNAKSSTMFSPGMPSTRSQDSSFLRSLDHNTP